MSWYISAFKKYVKFSGRARRKEYWMFYLFNVIFLSAIIILEMNVLNITFENSFYGPFSLIYTLAVLLPFLSVTTRRLHDTGRSGWWILIPLVPFIGSIWFFVIMCTEGDKGLNRYGKDPKEKAFFKPLHRR